MPTGIVKWFNDAKGYGFIACEGFGDVFVHYSDISGRGHRSLTEGQKVELEVVYNDQGRARATNVQRPDGKGMVTVTELPMYNATGEVTCWRPDDGYGFIEVSGVGSVYCNVAVLAADVFEDDIVVGTQVTLDVFPPRPNRPRPEARDVRPVGSGDEEDEEVRWG